MRVNQNETEFKVNNCHNLIQSQYISFSYFLEILQNSKFGTPSLTQSYDDIILKMSNLGETESKVYIRGIERENKEIEAKLKLLGLNEEIIVSTAKQLVVQSIQPDFLSLSKTLKNGKFYTKLLVSYGCTPSKICMILCHTL